jgi:hypothetical protein
MDISPLRSSKLFQGVSVRRLDVRNEVVMPVCRLIIHASEIWNSSALKGASDDDALFDQSAVLKFPGAAPLFAGFSFAGFGQSVGRKIENAVPLWPGRVLVRIEIEPSCF